MDDLEKELWHKCFLKAIDLWQSGNKPPVYDDDCEPIEYFFDYCHSFADACVIELRMAMYQGE